MKINRRKARVIRIGRVLIGGDHPVAIQSMTKCKTVDTARAIRQIAELEKAGCAIVRLAIKDMEDARALRSIKAKVKVPLVADIHFSYRLAIAAIDNGADKIRLNPGNIHKKSEVEAVISAAKGAGIPLRVGLNSGSVKDAGRRAPMAARLVASCMDYIRMIEKLRFNDIVVSLKANNVLDTVEAYRKVAGLCAYPLHLGVTATGSPYQGIIKSSVALGALLMEGIGDTIRVSLTDSPAEEVRASKCILESLGLRKACGAQIISCPTCGRCEVDLIKAVKEIEERLSTMASCLPQRPLNLAVMGCVVNGPGEAKEADVGIAFGSKEGLLFRKGKPVRKVPFKQCAKAILEEMKRCY